MIYCDLLGCSQTSDRISINLEGIHEQNQNLETFRYFGFGGIASELGYQLSSNAFTFPAP